MTKLIIGFSYAPTKPFSKLIKWATNSQVSHAFVVLPEANGTVIYQASGLVVNYQNLGSFKAVEAPVKFFEFDITDAQATKNSIFRLTTVGKPYAWQEIFGYGWVLLARKFGRRVINPYAGGTTAYVCVDIAAAHLPSDPEPIDGSMTPDDLMVWCAANGKDVTQDVFQLWNISA